MPEAPLQSIRSLSQAGATLKARRKACKMTQEQLGALTGVVQPTISHIECGTMGVSLEFYIRLLEALDAGLCVADRLVDKGSS